MVTQFGNDRNRTMSEDQFCQVVDAILNGKYSWACLLILQFAGYNPLHYIPYRTYNRLMKENCPAKKRRQLQREDHPEPSLTVDNLPHIYSLDNCSSRVKGGSTYYAERPFMNIKTFLSHWN